MKMLLREQSPHYILGLGMIYWLDWRLKIKKKDSAGLWSWAGGAPIGELPSSMLIESTELWISKAGIVRRDDIVKPRGPCQTGGVGSWSPAPSDSLVEIHGAIVITFSSGIRRPQRLLVYKGHDWELGLDESRIFSRNTLWSKWSKSSAFASWRHDTPLPFTRIGS
jgi:hypothetical protein